MIEIDKIYNEDCLEGMKRIDDGSVDCIITDLPYEVLNDGNPNAQWDRQIPLEPLWAEYLRISKPNAAIVLFAQGMFTAKLMMSNEKMWRYNLVWDKVRTTGFLNANRMPLRCHEDICVFYRELPTYHPQMVKCLPHQRNHSRGKQEGEQTNRCYGSFGKADDYISDEKYPRSIIELANIVQNNEHPTQKPVDLIRYLVLTYTDVGGGSSGLLHRQRHDGHCLSEGTSALRRLRAEQGVFRHRPAAHRHGAQPAHPRLRRLVGAVLQLSKINH